jgi:hypothetical protein
MRIHSLVLLIVLLSALGQSAFAMKKPRRTLLDTYLHTGENIEITNKDGQIEYVVSQTSPYFEMQPL